jgi:hypothetical protein
MVHLCRALLAVVLMLSCFSAEFASAQQMPLEFLELMASDEPKLTPEQAAQVAGFYNMTDIVRLAGDDADQTLKAAIEAAAQDGAAINYENVMNEALDSSDIVTAYALWIPYIDPQSGFFFAYRLIQDPNSPFPGVKRLLGAALGRPDGSVLLVANNDEDVAVAQGLYKNDTIYWNYMEGIENWADNGETKLGDQTVFSAKLEKAPVPEVLLDDLKEVLPLKVNIMDGAPSSSANNSPSTFAAVKGMFAAVLAIFYIVY